MRQGKKSGRYAESFIITEENDVESERAETWMQKDDWRYVFAYCIENVCAQLEVVTVHCIEYHFQYCTFLISENKEESNLARRFYLLVLQN